MKLYCLGDSLTFGFGMSRNVRWTTLVEQEAGWLQLPYLLWVTFAAYLNLGVWLLNR